MSCLGKHLCSSELRHLVTVEQPTRSVDSLGGRGATTWSTRTTIWCAIEEKSGSEKYDHGRVETRATVEFWCRYQPGILETDRLSFDGKVYNIRAVDNYKRRNVWLKITAEEGVVD